MGADVKVLIVDGGPNRQTVIAKILAERDCQLFEVDCSEEALRTAHSARPEIAIVNLLTPKLDRGAFVHQLRRDPKIAGIPIIFYADGYLEIASGQAADMDSLLRPILLCEEAIRGQARVEEGGSVYPFNVESQSGHNGAESVQEVFTFAFDSGAERVLIKPGDLIAEVVHKARKTFPKSIEIAAAYSEDLRPIEGDRSQLNQVLNNLFSNARDAMPKGGSLLALARNFDVDQKYASMTMGARLGQYVMIRVSDTGRGTPRPVVYDIFDPFRKIKEVGPETNLGLIRSHGGFMSVYSDLGKGTIFQIFLPAYIVEGNSALKQGTQGEK